MKYLKLYENFENEPLKRQFHEVVASGIKDEDDRIGDFWTEFTGFIIKLRDCTENTLYKEMMYRIIDDEDPVYVLNDILNRSDNKNPEMEVLLKKLSNINPYKYREENYNDDDDEEMEM